MIYNGYDITTSKTILEYPVTLAEVKQHLRIERDNYDEDYLLDGYIMSAVQEAESYINKDIAYKRSVSKVWDFGCDNVDIREGNLNTIESVMTDASVSVGINQDDTHAYFNYFTLWLNNSVTSDPLYVTYTTGWERTDCPQKIKQAIMIRVADYYDFERSNYITGTMVRNNQVFERLLSSYCNTEIIF